MYRSSYSLTKTCVYKSEVSDIVGVIIELMKQSSYLHKLYRQMVHGQVYEEYVVVEMLLESSHLR